MKRVLMIAYHFPPLAGSSGIQRTLRFVQQLSNFGWEPLVLTAHPRAYERTSDDLMRDVPPQVPVRRAFALDTARHLSLRGRYAGFMARPDRWVSWRFDALRQGLSMIREFQPQALWSTYPIATAHLIGARLQAASGLPWIADFRDPMAQEGYPADPVTRQQFVEIESHAAATAAFSVFTTPGAARTYRERYPAHAERMHVIENGYDEEAFASVPPENRARPLDEARVTLLHSGIVYPQERDPSALLAAMGRLKKAGRLSAKDLRIRFRAAVHDDLLKTLAAQHDVLDLIEVCPPVPYRQALEEMCRADGLLVMQAGDCNDQIPGKLYEYLRADRPILCLADPRGDTWALVADSGMRAHADLADAEAISHALIRFIDAVRNGTAGRPLPAAIASASRMQRSEQLAGLLNNAVR